MRRALVLLLAAALLVGLAPAAEGASTAKAKAKVKCHWVKATKKRKRHKVCVKVKARTPEKVAARTPAAGPKGAAAPGADARPGAAVSPGASAAPDGTAAPGAGAAPASPGAPAPPTVPAAPDPTTPAPAAAARLQATTREWSITLSRPSLPAGEAIVQLVNRGEDGHDLHLRPASGGGDLLAIPETASFGVADATATLAPGPYTLYCSLPGHEAAGMKATLSVQ